MVRAFIFHFVGLTASITRVCCRDVNGPRGPSWPGARPASSYFTLRFAHRTPFPLAFFLLPPTRQTHSHLMIHRHVLNRKFLFLFCVCLMLFLVPAKKGKKRKAQREEEHSNKTRKTLTSKEVRVFGLQYHLAVESRNSVLKMHSFLN